LKSFKAVAIINVVYHTSGVKSGNVSIWIFYEHLNEQWAWKTEEISKYFNTLPTLLKLFAESCYLYGGGGTVLF